MENFKNKIKVTVFLLFFLFSVFSGSLFAAAGPFLNIDEKVVFTGNECSEEVWDSDYRTADNGTNLICYLEALANLFGDLSECEESSPCWTPWINFIGCLLGCIAGADSCEDELTIDPDFATVKPGESQRFTAAGGTGDYVFSLLRDNSGAVFVDNLDGTADYAAGEIIDVTDVVQVKDDNGKTADANIFVSPEACTFLVEPEGGAINCDLGLSIEFPAGAVESITTCSITIDETPEAFPKYLESFSPAFNVQLGVELKLPVKITFNNIESSEAGSLGIYISEGGDWAFAGGAQDGSTVYSYVKNLSLFRVGKGQSLHKAFEFYPIGSGEATVSVAEYALTYSGQDTPISKAYSIPVETDRKQKVFFPLGKYRFCVEWYNDFWQYKFEGSAVPADDNIILKETDSLINPPDVIFNLIGGSPGYCPDCENKAE